MEISIFPPTCRYVIYTPKEGLMITEHLDTLLHPYPFGGVREVILRIILIESQAVHIGCHTLGDTTKTNL